jgi:arylsulfatase A-like enzyme
MITRRDFLKTASGAVAGALVASGCDGADPNDVTLSPNTPNGKRPNILLVLVDEMRQPPVAYAAGEGEAQGLKEILRFESELSAGNPYTGFMSGFMRFRKNAVVLRNHYTAAAACAPSRTTFLTGQYPSLHGVTQVNGTFKVPDDIYFLDPNGVPTVGDWFRAGGYETHYFGKWHVSNTSQPPYDLEPWGFSSYESSGPDPDSSVPGLGAYRDPGFTEIISSFFAQKASEKDKPWFAVASFANPHDTGAYPVPFFLPGNLGVTNPLTGKNTPQPIPPQGDLSNSDDERPLVPLNPDGFPQQTFELPQTWSEDLSAKPDCHLDSAFKMQMALAAAFPLQLQENVLFAPSQTLSTQLQMEWVKATGQFYLYLQYLVNIEIDLIMQAFDEAGLDKDTIVIFTSDHGSNIMAHNQMVQKFFTAYEESTRVPFVISSPLVNPNDTVEQIDLVTSHIDLAPTLLGLAGFGEAQIQQLKAAITGQTEVRDFPGINLVPYIATGQPLPRPGVLFTTSDDATLPAYPVTASNQKNHENFQTFLDRVDGLIADPDSPSPRFPGACVEPNAVHMLSTGDWKYCRYYDDVGNEPDQYEMYHLASDRRETTNLLDFKTGALRPGVAVPGLSTAQLQAQLELLRAQLAEQEASLLLTPT